MTLYAKGIAEEIERRGFLLHFETKRATTIVCVDLSGNEGALLQAGQQDGSARTVGFELLHFLDGGVDDRLDQQRQRQHLFH